MTYKKILFFLFALICIKNSLDASIFPWSKKETQFKDLMQAFEQKELKTPTKKEQQELLGSDISFGRSISPANSMQGVSPESNNNTPQQNSSPSTPQLQTDKTEIFIEPNDLTEQQTLQEEQEKARFELILEQGLARTELNRLQKNSIFWADQSYKNRIRHSSLWHPADNVLLTKISAMLLLYLNLNAGNFTFINWTKPLPINIQRVLARMHVPIDDVEHLAKRYSQEYTLETFEQIEAMVDTPQIITHPNISKLLSKKILPHESYPEAIDRLFNIVKTTLEKEEQIQTKLLKEFTKEQLVYIAALIGRIPVIYQPEFIDFKPNKYEITFNLYF